MLETTFLARHVSFLDKQLMKLLASCLVSCHFDYACISWMSDLSRGWLDKLQKSQNKLIRLVSGFSRFTHVEVSHFRCCQTLSSFSLCFHTLIWSFLFPVISSFIPICVWFAPRLMLFPLIMLCVHKPWVFPESLSVNSSMCVGVVVYPVFLH